MHRVTLFCFLALSLLLSGCDGSGSDPSPDPTFEARVGSPVHTSLTGEAALGNEASFKNGRLFTFTVPQLDKTVTAIQLAGTGDDDRPHSLSFTYIADERITEGSYELVSPEQSFGKGADGSGGIDRSDGSTFGLDTLFTASYGRRTADSVFAYALDGTVTIESVDEDPAEGQFDLEALRVIGIHRDSLRSFIADRRDRTEPVRLTPPPLAIRALDPPMPVRGRFTAVPQAFDERVPHFDWILPQGLMGS